MRCEWCRDPGRIPKQLEICQECGPRFYAMENLAEAAMAWHREAGSVEVLVQALRVACDELDKLERQP